MHRNAASANEWTARTGRRFASARRCPMHGQRNKTRRAAIPAVPGGDARSQWGSGDSSSQYPDGIGVENRSAIEKKTSCADESCGPWFGDLANARST